MNCADGSLVSDPVGGNETSAPAVPLVGVDQRRLWTIFRARIKAPMGSVTMMNQNTASFSPATETQTSKIREAGTVAG